MIKIYDMGEISHYLTGDDIVKFKNFIKDVKDHDKEKFSIKSPSSDTVVKFWYKEYGDEKVLFGSRCTYDEIPDIYSFRINIYEFGDRIKLTYSDCTVAQMNAVIKDGECYVYDYWDFLEVLNKAIGVEVYKITKEFDYYD